MGQAQYLIDSNAVINYLGNKLPANGMAFMDTVVDDVPNISVVTKIEVLGFNAPEEHYRLLTDFMGDATILDLAENIVDASIEVRKNNRNKLPDAIIAATALVYGLTLVSRNTGDFKNIDGLTCINPWEL